MQMMDFGFIGKYIIKSVVLIWDGLTLRKVVQLLFIVVFVMWM